MLDRTRTQQRKFKRLTAARLGEILGNGGGAPAGRRRHGHRPRRPGHRRPADPTPPVAPPVPDTAGPVEPIATGEPGCGPGWQLR